MPTYDYRCKNCGYVFEKFQMITAEPLGSGDCPVCAGDVERLISGGAGLLFRGSGFYFTDYRSEGYKKAASEEKKSSEKPKSENKSKPGSKASAA